MAATSPISGNLNKPPKTGREGSSRRKISLPWFRQASFGEKLTKLRLPRQTTVDVDIDGGVNSAPNTACVSSDKFGNFRRKVLSSSASVEV